MKPCFDYALHYINRFPKTEYELRLQLRKKGYDDKEIQDAMLQLFELNYVNDYEYCKLYLGSECSRKGKPLYKVRGKLLQKGVDKELLSDVVDEVIDEVEEGIFVKLEKLIKEMRNKGLDIIEIYQKLTGRGYDRSRVRDVMKHIADDQEFDD